VLQNIQITDNETAHDFIFLIYSPHLLTTEYG